MEDQEKNIIVRHQSFIKLGNNGPLCFYCGLPIAILHGWLPRELCQITEQEAVDSDITESIKDLELFGICSCTSCFKYEVEFIPKIGFSVTQLEELDDLGIKKPRF